MNKQQQIEEIAKTMCEDFGTDVCKFDCPCMNTCANEDISERLYNAGYRKLPEDSVVLTETERITMCIEQWDKGFAQARKETAEKILNYLELSGIDTALFNTKIKPYVESMYGIDSSCKPIVGIDIQQDNVDESRLRLRSMFLDKFPNANSFCLYMLATILCNNIICADSLVKMQEWIDQNQPKQLSLFKE